MLSVKAVSNGKAIIIYCYIYILVNFVQQEELKQKTIAIVCTLYISLSNDGGSNGIDPRDQNIPYPAIISIT